MKKNNMKVKLSTAVKARKSSPHAFLFMFWALNLAIAFFLLSS